MPNNNQKEKNDLSNDDIALNSSDKEDKKPLRFEDSINRVKNFFKTNAKEEQIARDKDVTDSTVPHKKYQFGGNTKKIVIIGGVIVFVLVALRINGMQANEYMKQIEEDLSKYSISIDNADNGEVTFDCNILPDSNKCDEIKVSGFYTRGNRSSANLIVNKDEAEIMLKGNDGFYILYNATLDNNPSTTLEKSLRICFGDNGNCSNSYPSYDLIVNINISDDDRQKLKEYNERLANEQAEEEAKKQAEEEAKKQAEEEAEQAKQAEKQSQNAPKQNSSQTNNTPSSSSAKINSSKPYKVITISDGSSCPSNTLYCFISKNSSGYVNRNYAYLRGKIINNTGKDLSYLEVTGDVYNASGAKIGDCWGNTSGLTSGGTWEFEAYCTAWSSGASVDNIDVNGW